MKKREAFEFKTDEHWFNQADILVLDSDGTRLEILSMPTTHYNRRYWRILNFITFKLFFNPRYTYICKIQVQDPVF